MDQHDTGEVWDFTIPDLPKRFKVDESGEVFEGPPVLGPRQLVTLAKAAKSIKGLMDGGDEEAFVEGLNTIFLKVLTPESGPKFVERLADETRPIDLRRQIMPILFKLMEAYGLRPTQPSEPSLIVSVGPDGTSSTGGVPAEESTPSDSTPDGSST